MERHSVLIIFLLAPLVSGCFGGGGGGGGYPPTSGLPPLSPTGSNPPLTQNPPNTQNPPDQQPPADDQKDQERPPTIIIADGDKLIVIEPPATTNVDQGTQTTQKPPEVNPPQTQTQTPPVVQPPTRTAVPPNRGWITSNGGRRPNGGISLIGCGPRRGG